MTAPTELIARLEAVKARTLLNGVVTFKPQISRSDLDDTIAALRTQAPDSWRPDREAVDLLKQWVDAFDGLGSGSGPLINATRSYLALRPQTAESGT